MKIVSMNDAEREPFPDPIFTGPDVARQLLAPDSREFSVNVIHFGKGVRNKFHAHDGEQILIVTAGKGIVATEEEERMVAVGDVILIPAGERHRHGATADSEFSHIYVTRSGRTLTRLEE